ncbi:hypothetical protein KC909_05355 [Candidatus Dojkabacteria bacterium]|uniref:Uncharacterized protein n=1 Tax=Candidatus Dojkabacteria bacterium TaxID=2099670 RepID=A0A955L683_9BACT|nr:hypothetical protein [Candidatus Dojkabacteria bacterium]
MNQVSEEEKGIKLDITPAQVVVIIGMFIVFFVAPVMIFSPKQEQATITESYTESALTTDNSPSVAGISTQAETQTSTGYFQFPGTSHQFSTDISNPATLAIVIGSVFGIFSLGLFLSMFFDFFRG